MGYLNVSNLIQDNLSEEKTVLLHGTSIEAVIALLQTEVFNFRVPRPDSDYKYDGHLFFMPNGAFFEDNNLGVDPKLCTWEYITEAVKGNARMVACDHYAFLKLGFLPENIGELYPPIRDESVQKFLMPEMEKKGYDQDYVDQLKKELSQRKGVIIGIDKRIFELKIKKGKDEPEQEVCLYLPNGLDIKYINGIKPLGEIERKIIEDYSRTTGTNIFTK